MVSEVTFDRFKHFTRVGVGLPRGVSARFLIDTGIGITVVSTSLKERYDLEETGETFRGRRMSGQEVEAALLNLPPLTLGTHSFDGHVGAALDLSEEGEGQEFDGILGLDLLGQPPLTINPFDNTVVLGQLPPEIVESETGSHVVAARVHRDGPSVDFRADLRLPDKTVVEVEVDTGSAVTILDTSLMPACSVQGTEDGARIMEGTDETGHAFVRTFIPLPGAVCLSQAPATALRQPTVMFQDLALNGLIGTEYLDRYIQTYNTRAGTITLRERAKS